jgi:hypothetical protein
VANYLHYNFYAGNTNVIQVTLTGWANVLLLDDTNYNNYRNGRKYQYYGGLAETRLYTIRPPYHGHWNVVVNRGGYTGSVTASVKLL